MSNEHRATSSARCVCHVVIFFCIVCLLHKIFVHAELAVETRMVTCAIFLFLLKVLEVARGAPHEMMLSRIQGYLGRSMEE